MITSEEYLETVNRLNFINEEIEFAEKLKEPISVIEYLKVRRDTLKLALEVTDFGTEEPYMEW